MNFITILIILVAIAIYSLITYYIGYNGWVWLRTTLLKKHKKIYVAIIIFLAISIFAGQFLPIAMFKIIGSIWMAILAFSLLVLPITNIIYFALKKKGIFWIGFSVVSLFVCLYIYGSFNAWSPVIKTYDIAIDKKSKLPELKIVMASDFHLGSIVGINHLERFEALVKQEKPDIVLIPGDIIDDNIEPFLKNKMSNIIGKIEAPLGVYAVLGNHDYYGNDMVAVIEEMEKIGVQMLMDEYVSTNQDLYIVGRKEHTDKTRKNISDFMQDLDVNKPIIMMDHQPKDLAEAQENGVDLLLSGHTHGGQIAPGNLITNMIFENDYGYLRKENLHSIVSSGFGTWGPALRIGTRSEVVVINVAFLKK